MFTGSLVALVTPMDTGGAIDWPTLKNLVDWHIQEGTHGIVAVGTTGESATLTVPEHIQVIEKIVEWVAGRVPVIAGTGGNSTYESIEMTVAAEELGADAALLVTPYYNKPTQEGLYQHFCAIAQSSAIPQILYNVPGRTACDLLPETVARLSQVDNIVGIKEATGDVERGVAILNRASKGFSLYSGDDATFLDLMAIGATANISVTANVTPSVMATICQKANEDDLQAARTINKALLPLHRSLFVESNPIPVKWALHKMGKIASGIRLPLTPLSESHQADLSNALKSIELI